MTTPEANEDVVRQYVAAFNRGDVDTLRELFTRDAVVHGVLGSGGLAVAVPIWRELHAAFRVELVVESLVAEGDTVAVRYTERGTFVGPFRGQEPTGRSYELVAMEWFVLRDGRICSRWGARDHASKARHEAPRVPAHQACTGRDGHSTYAAAVRPRPHATVVR